LAVSKSPPDSLDSRLDLSDSNITGRSLDIPSYLLLIDGKVQNNYTIGV